MTVARGAESGDRSPVQSHDVGDVVLLHGWGSTAGVWKELRTRLSQRLRVSAPDLPGYGSSTARAPCTVESMADAIARSAPRRCHVVGWSLGGLVALAWAMAAPEQVGRLALIATTPSFLQRPGWPEAMAEETFAGFEAALAADPAGALRRFVSLQSQDDEQARSVARRLRDTMAPAAAALLGAGLLVLRSTDLRARLRSVRAPALVLHGSRDRLVPAAAGERLSRLLPAARYLAVPGAAHAPFLSDPAAVAAALQDHLYA
jgi:pimeloyl-[acyl-carrier protein] methyl ester esterase